MIRKSIITGLIVMLLLMLTESVFAFAVDAKMSAPTALRNGSRGTFYGSANYYDSTVYGAPLPFTWYYETGMTKYRLKDPGLASTNVQYRIRVTADYYKWYMPTRWAWVERISKYLKFRATAKNIDGKARSWTYAKIAATGDQANAWTKVY